MTKQNIREKVAYSIPAVLLSRLLQATVYPNARAHWIRDAFAGHKSFASLK